MRNQNVLIHVLEHLCCHRRLPNETTKNIYSMYRRMLVVFGRYHFAVAAAAVACMPLTCEWGKT